MVQTATSGQSSHSSRAKCQSILYLVDISNGRRQKLDFEVGANHLAWHFLFKTPGGPYGQLHQYAVKFLLPTSSGYILRADFLERRMLDNQFAARVVGFSRPRQYFKSPEMKTGSEDFLTAMSLPVGAVLLDRKWSRSVMPSLQALETELFNRISGPFLSRKPISRKMLALVDGRRDFTVSAAAEGIFRAAQALDIGLVVLDKPGHWLQSLDKAYLRDVFLPIDMTVDEGLARRIEQGIRDYGGVIDGITTFSDHYLFSTAQAAESLGLPTSPPTAFATCTNKYETRMLDPGSCQFFRVSGLKDLEALLADENTKLQFPMIVKPCRGTSSEGVFKVNNSLELRLAVERITSSAMLTGKYGGDVMLESYISGPEVDVNLVLADGKIIFSEISDDFPSPGDSETAIMSDSFVDVANTIPSALPTQELDLLRSKAQDILLGLGFRDGVFHVEARVRNSAMHYTTQDGAIDLHTNLEHNDRITPTVFLVEINARMPGNQETTAIERAYGIDYYTVYILSALGEVDRLRMLAEPFRDGPQYWCQVLRFHAKSAGIWSSGNACEELISRRPELRQYISYHRCLFKRGQEVPTPTTNVVVFVAYFVLFSRTSRGHLLSVAETVRKEFQYKVTPNGSKDKRVLDIGSVSS
jgi:biotin carboxylase